MAITYYNLMKSQPMFRIAHPKDKIARYKITDPIAMFFIYQFENQVDWASVNSLEDLITHVEAVMIPSLYKLIDPESENNYYMKDFPLEIIRGFYHGERNAEGEMVHLPDPNVVKTVNNAENEEEGFKLAQAERLSEINKNKKLGFFKWWNSLTQENVLTKNNKILQYIILNKILESSPPLSRMGVPDYKEQVVNEIVNKIKSSEGKVFNVIKSYNALVGLENEKSNKLEGSTIKNGTGWFGIASKITDPINFEKNREILGDYSRPVGWCTYPNGPGDHYLPRGDFWVYVLDGEAKVAIRFDGNTIMEMRGNQKVGDANVNAADYWEDIYDLAERKKWDLSKIASYSPTLNIMQNNKEFNDRYNKSKEDGAPLQINSVSEFRSLSKENRKEITSEQLDRPQGITDQLMVQFRSAYDITRLDAIIASIPRELSSHFRIQQEYISRYVQMVPLKELNNLPNKKKNAVFLSILNSTPAQTHIAQGVNIHNINDVPLELANAIFKNDLFMANITESFNENPSLIGTIDIRLLKRLPRHIIFDNPKMPLINIFTNNPTFIFTLYSFIKDEITVGLFCNAAKKGLINFIKNNPQSIYDVDKNNEQSSIQYIFNKQNLENETKYLKEPRLKQIIESPEIKEALRASFAHAPVNKLGEAYSIMESAGVKLNPEDVIPKLERFLKNWNAHIPQATVNVIASLDLWDKMRDILVEKINAFPFNIVTFPPGIIERDPIYMKTSLTKIYRHLRTLTPVSSDYPTEDDYRSSPATVKRKNMIVEEKEEAYASYMSSNQTEIKIIQDKFKNTFERVGGKTMNNMFNFGNILKGLKEVREGNAKVQDVVLPVEYLKDNWERFSDEFSIILDNGGWDFKMKISEYPEFLQNATFANDFTFKQLYADRLVRYIDGKLNNSDKTLSDEDSALIEVYINSPDDYGLEEKHVTSITSKLDVFLTDNTIKRFKSLLPEEVMELYMLLPARQKQLPQIRKIVEENIRNQIINNFYSRSRNFNTLINVAVRFPEFTEDMLKDKILIGHISRIINSALLYIADKDIENTNEFKESLVNYVGTEQGRAIMQKVCSDKLKQTLNNIANCGCFGEPINHPQENQPVQRDLPIQPPQQPEVVQNENRPQVQAPQAPNGIGGIGNGQQDPHGQQDNIQAKKNVFNLHRMAKRIN